MTEPLPELLDCKRLQRELGITRAAAEKIMRALPLVQFEDLRKTFVTRASVLAYIKERTLTNDDVVR